MPNGDMSPMTDDEIQDFMVALLTPDEMQTLIAGGGWPSTQDLIGRAYPGGVIREMLVQVFGEVAVSEFEDGSL